jgi:hypothetical protein
MTPHSQQKITITSMSAPGDVRFCDFGDQLRGASQEQALAALRAELVRRMGAYRGERILTAQRAYAAIT